MRGRRPPVSLVKQPPAETSAQPGGAHGRASAGAEYEIGDFRQGSPWSQWALARYLVGRALAESVGRALLLVAAALVVLAVVLKSVLHSTAGCVLVAIVAVMVVLARWALLAIVRRLTGWRRFGPLEERVSDLAARTRSDVLAELRRCGLPGRTLTLPLLALRLASARRRPDTLARLRRFEVTRAVPPGRLDELHLVLRGTLRGGLRSDAAARSGSARRAG